MSFNHEDVEEEYDTVFQEASIMRTMKEESGEQLRHVVMRNPPYGGVRMDEWLADSLNDGSETARATKPNLF